MSLDLEEEDGLFTFHTNLHLGSSYKTCKLCSSLSSNLIVTDGKGVRLPKLEVPTFNGDVLH